MVTTIPTVEEMESKLLQDSAPEDIIKPEEIQEQPQKKLKIHEIRHDISVLARTFIKVYCGWPFYDEIAKRKILQFLLNMYDNANDMTAEKFFNQISQLIANIADKHMAVLFGGQRFGTKLGPIRKNVGKNIATRKEKYRVEIRNRIAIIALPTLRGWSDDDIQNFHKMYTEILPKSVATIIDLRRNGGGSSNPTSPLVFYLYGAKTPTSRRTWMRNTDEAKIIYNRRWGATGLSDRGIATTDDPFIKSQSDGYPEFESERSGYRKPIYVLTDGETRSAAEMFCTCLRKHPFIKFVGENTAGCEVYGNSYGVVVLPESHITFTVGMDYHELFQDNFELYGYAPDIKCETDAFEVAWKCLQNELKNNKIDTDIHSR